MTVCIGLMTCCALNNCDCSDDIVTCDKDDEQTPIFTATERFYGERVYLTGQQLDFAKTVCKTFQNLKALYVEATQCPRLNCPQMVCR